MRQLINGLFGRMATGHAPGILTGTIVTLALLFAAAACSDDSGSEKPQPTASGSTGQESAEARTVSVVTTTNIMADWVENIGGGNVDVFSLLPAGADPHTFQPGAQDVAKVSDADLVLSVGLGLEAAWLHDLLENAARDESAIVELGEIVDPIEFAQGHAGEVEDPHFWFDPPRVKLAVNDIAARLSMLDPDRGDTYSANASAYNGAARRAARLVGAAGRHGAGGPPAARDFPRQLRVLCEPVRIRGRGCRSIGYH